MLLVKQLFNLHFSPIISKLTSRSILRKNELILLLYVPTQTGGGVEAVLCLLPIFSAEKKTVEPEGQNLSEGRSAVQGL